MRIWAAVQINLTRIDLVVVGSLGDAYVDAVADYERRLGRYVKLHVHELRGEALQRGDAHVLQAEGAKLLAALDTIERATAGPTTVIALDRTGELQSSRELAQKLLATAHLCLVIGGAAGISAEVLARCTSRISLGKVTLPHQLARLVLTEQLYRAFRIAKNEPYHH